MGFNIGSKLSGLKVENSSLSGELEKLKKNVALIRENEDRLAMLTYEITVLKLENEALKRENSTRNNLVPIPQGDDLLRSQNDSLKAEAAKLKIINEKLLAKTAALEQKNSAYKKESEQFKSASSSHDEMKSDNDVLLSENNRLCAENARLKEQIGMLQLALVRVFKESAGESSDTPSQVKSNL